MSIEDGKVDSVETFLRKSVAELLLIVSQSLPFIGVSPYEAPTVIHLLSDQLMEKLRANLIEYVAVSESIIDKQLTKLGDKNTQAIKAAEDHVIENYTSLTRAKTKDWVFDEEDLAKLRYNDSPGPIWTVEVIPDVGFKLDPEEYQVYQVLNGDWIVEQ